MSKAACKTVICANKNSLRKTFANPLIAVEVGNDTDNQERVWECLEGKMTKSDRTFLESVLMNYIS